MTLFNGHDIKRGDVVKLTSANNFPANVYVTHVCARFIHVGGKLFWKTSGHGANHEATGYKLVK